MRWVKWLDLLKKIVFRCLTWNTKQFLAFTTIPIFSSSVVYLARVTCLPFTRYSEESPQIKTQNDSTSALNLNRDSEMSVIFLILTHLIWFCWRWFLRRGRYRSAWRPRRCVRQVYWRGRHVSGLWFASLSDWKLSLPSQTPEHPSHSTYLNNTRRYILTRWHF